MTLKELEQLAESGFTPGPWEGRFSPGEYHCHYAWKPEGGPQVLIAPKVTAFGERTVGYCEKTRQANRDLGAAAPSLLATAIAAKKREKELVEALSIMSELVYVASGNKIMSVWADHVDLRECVDGLEQALETAQKARALLKDIEQ